MEQTATLFTLRLTAPPPPGPEAVLKWLPPCEPGLDDNGNELDEDGNPNLFGFIPTLLNNWMDKESPYMVVEERGKDDDNLHYHVAGTIPATLQCLRSALNRVGYKGNEAYSLRAGDPELMDSHFDYLCKGTGTGKDDAPKVIFAHPDFTPAVIRERNKVYWKVNAELNKKKRKRSGAGDAPSAAASILKICTQKTEHSGFPLSEDQIIDIALEWTHRCRSSINGYHLKAVINHVAYSLNPNSNRIALLKNSLRF